MDGDDFRARARSTKLHGSRTSSEAARRPAIMPHSSRTNAARRAKIGPLNASSHGPHATCHMRSCGHTIRPGREFLFKSPEFLFLLSGFDAQIAQKFLVESTAKSNYVRERERERAGTGLKVLPWVAGGEPPPNRLVSTRRHGWAAARLRSRPTGEASLTT